MTAINHYLSPEQVECHASYNSKKRVLEAFSELFSQAADPEQSTLIFDALLKREKIGSTALGNGIAIPHARIDHLQAPKIAAITLQNPIDFDAPDQKPVDLLISLLVPNEQSELHLNLLKQLAGVLKNKKSVTQLRQSDSNKSLFDALVAATSLPHDDAKAS